MELSEQDAEKGWVLEKEERHKEGRRGNKRSGPNRRIQNLNSTSVPKPKKERKYNEQKIFLSGGRKRRTRRGGARGSMKEREAR